MVVDDQRHASAAFPPGWNLGIHCRGDWMRLRTGLDGFGGEKLSCLFQGFERPTIVVLGFPVSISKC